MVQRCSSAWSLWGPRILSVLRPREVSSCCGSKWNCPNVFHGRVALHLPHLRSASQSVCFSGIGAVGPLLKWGWPYSTKSKSILVAPFLATCENPNAFGPQRKKKKKGKRRGRGRERGALVVTLHLGGSLCHCLKSPGTGSTPHARMLITLCQLSQHLVHSMLSINTD